MRMQKARTSHLGRGPSLPILRSRLIRPLHGKGIVGEIASQMFQNPPCIFLWTQREHCSRKDNIELGIGSDVVVNFGSGRRVRAPSQMAFVGKGAEKTILLLEVWVSERLPEFGFMQCGVLKLSFLSGNMPLNHETLLYNPDCS